MLLCLNYPVGKKNHRKSKGLHLKGFLNKKENLHKKPYTLDLDLDPNIQ